MAASRAIGRFGAARLIGRGGFASVYRAADTDHDREVAIKVLSGSMGDSERRRFDRERRTLGRLSGHPNIIPVHESGYTDEGEGYLVMELATGGSLRDLLKRRSSVPWPEALRIMIPVARGVQAAHDAGVLHRDIKPDNILIDRFGNPRLSDFGIAVLAASMTTTVNTPTTVAHAAPEILEGQRATEASDVYALGSTLHTLVAGLPPFMRSDDDSITPAVTRALTQPAPDLRPFGVPEVVAEVVARTLSRQPGARPTSAGQLADELAAALVNPGSAPRRQARSAGPMKVPAMAIPVDDQLPMDRGGGLSSLTMPATPTVIDMRASAGRRTRAVDKTPPTDQAGFRRGRTGWAVAALTMFLVGAVGLILVTQDPPTIASEVGAADSPPGSVVRDPAAPTADAASSGGVGAGADAAPSAGSGADPAVGVPGTIGSAAGPARDAGPDPALIRVPVPTPEDGSAGLAGAEERVLTGGHGTVAAASATAQSSVDACGAETNYGAANLIDGRLHTAWRTPGDGVGQWVEIDLGAARQVSMVGLVPGYAKLDPCDGVDRFTQNRRLLTVRWTVGGQSIIQRLDPDRPELQWLVLDQAVISRGVRMEILSTTEPGARDFTAISDLAVVGR